MGDKAPGETKEEKPKMSKAERRAQQEAQRAAKAAKAAEDTGATGDIGSKAGAGESKENAGVTSNANAARAQQRGGAGVEGWRCAQRPPAPEERAQDNRGRLRQGQITPLG